MEAQKLIDAHLAPTECRSLRWGIARPELQRKSLLLIEDLQGEITWLRERLENERLRLDWMREIAAAWQRAFYGLQLLLTAGELSSILDRAKQKYLPRS